MNAQDKSRFKLLFEIANDLGLDIQEVDGVVVIVTDLSNKQINRLGWY